MNRSDLVAEIIQYEQLAQAARDRASNLRTQLAADATAEWQEHGSAPTWRMDHGTVSLPITHDAIVVADPDRLVAWMAQHHPTEVETVRRVRESYLAHIRSQWCRTADVDGQPVVVDPRDPDTPVPGLSWQPGGQPGALSIRADPAAKRFARDMAEARLQKFAEGGA
jgi:hypothetical protein